MKYQIAKKQCKSISKSNHDNVFELFYDVASRNFYYFKDQNLIETVKNKYDRDDVSLYHFIQSGKPKV